MYIPGMNEKQATLGHPRGKLPLAPEGWPFIIPTFLLLAVSAGQTIIARNAGA